ncbi:MAG: hypothetical protein JSR96_12710 [Proteobacteria bacterium]|nr:hypothetical protein [Pseudomonadota bacterium]
MRSLAMITLMAGAALLTACGQRAGDAAAAPTTTPTAAPTQSSLSVLPKAVPPSTSRDPQEVLLSWAKAVSIKDWPSAYGYWGDHGAASGLTLDQFTAQWGRLGQPDLEIGKGRSEGAAGSSFYTAPVTLIDGGRRIKGEVVLRRVNDVDGATPEQLRWHIESTTLKP